MRIVGSFHKEKIIICSNLYDSNECSIFKRASTENILGTMLLCNTNLIIIIILYFFL